MKSFRVALLVVIALLSTAAFAQSSAQKSFDQLKSLEGVWTGKAVADPPQAQP